jgi:hypothetical protein
MLQGYVDDSGSDGQQPPYVLAGFLMPVEKWAQFADDWKFQLDRQPAIEYFKMSEACSRVEQFARNAARDQGSKNSRSTRSY